MNNFVVSSRDIQRKYKDIMERVKHTKNAALVVSQNEPQVAIISLEDYEELRRARMRKGLEDLERLAHQISEEHTDNPLPSDMSVYHDRYLGEALEEDLGRIHRQHDDNH